MPDAALEKRLDRIEGKVDSLQTALTILAKIEERQAHAGQTHRVIFKKLEEHGHRIGALDERIQSVEGKQILSSGKIGFAERLFWILVAVLAGLLPRVF